MGLLRRVWFQVHWFLGITAGSVLVLIGLTGATLSFRAEIVDALNPALRHIAPPTADATPLLPADLATRLQAAHPTQRIATLTVFAEPGQPGRVNFAPPAGQRRGEVRQFDPFTAALLPEPRGDAFFEFVERLHRWLLLPRDDGKPVTGTLAAALLVLALSGLYLRWPRRPLAWRAWLRLDFALRGRAFLWNLHAVVGTVALVGYLVSSLTGLYWAFDGVRSLVDNAAGEGRAARMERVQGGTAKPAGRPDLSAVWQSFLKETDGDWRQVTLRLPARNASQVEATYLRTNAEHERARNRLYLDAVSGEVSQHERYADKPLAGRLVHSIYPLHMGSYWGLPGRIFMTLSSLGLALFAITGWMLYLGRRRTAKAVQAERAMLRAGPSGSTAASGENAVLVAYATQTGRAERLALHTAASLQAAGIAAEVKSVAQIDIDALQHHRRLLLVASSFGEGDPPDSARAFARRLQSQPGAALKQLRYAILALGDRQYAAFCGFGHRLDHDLQTLGAESLFPMIEVDDGDAAALARWSAALAEVFGAAGLASAVADAAAPFDRWTLARRTLLNAGSQGAPLFALEFTPVDATPRWVPGALAELRLPAPLATRKYSVASLADDGHLLLLVRQARHDNGLGVASGWLTVDAPIGSVAEFRLQPNPAFALVDDDRPCIFIGNGSGYAGLRGHLLERVRRGHGRNWLVFGERQAAHDAFCAVEITAWRETGMLERADLAFSRDPGACRYVQDHLRAAGDTLRHWVDTGACLYVCGSRVGMASGVDAALLDILGADGFDTLMAHGRYRRDVY